MQLQTPSFIHSFPPGLVPSLLAHIEKDSKQGLGGFVWLCLPGKGSRELRAVFFRVSNSAQPFPFPAFAQLLHPLHSQNTELRAPFPFPELTGIKKSAHTSWGWAADLPGAVTGTLQPQLLIFDSFLPFFAPIPAGCSSWEQM